MGSVSSVSQVIFLTVKVIFYLTYLTVQEYFKHGVQTLPIISSFLGINTAN